MKKRVKHKTVKWAQLSKLERAYQKAKKYDRNFMFDEPLRSERSAQYKRDRNRYYQLLGHWCKLKKEQESKGVSNS